MDELYREEILEHYRTPHNVGTITVVPQGGKLYRLTASNHGCGDSIQADLLVADGKIVDVKWDGDGCAISKASMSMVSDWVIGKKIADVKKLGRDKILEFMGLPEIAEAREKCALIPMQIFSADL